MLLIWLVEISAFAPTYFLQTKIFREKVIFCNLSWFSAVSERKLVKTSKVHSLLISSYCLVHCWLAKEPCSSLGSSLLHAFHDVPLCLRRQVTLPLVVNFGRCLNSDNTEFCLCLISFSFSLAISSQFCSLQLSLSLSVVLNQPILKLLYSCSSFFTQSSLFLLMTSSTRVRTLCSSVAWSMHSKDMIQPQPLSSSHFALAWVAYDSKARWSNSCLIKDKFSSR